MHNFKLIFDLGENDLPIREEDGRKITFIQLDLSEHELMAIIRKLYSKNRTTAFGKRFIRFVSECLNRTDRKIINDLPLYRL